MPCCSEQRQHLPVTFPTAGRYLYLLLPRQIISRKSSGVKHIGRRTLVCYHSTGITGRRSHIHYIIRTQHDIPVMFDHNDCIATVAQLLQRTYQPHVITLVQPDRGFIKYIQHIDKLRSYLCGQTYALAFTTAQRCRRTRKAQIIQAYVSQELQPRINLFQYLFGNHSFLT